MRKPSISIRCVTDRFALQAPWSTFPRTAWTGASAPSLASTSGLPTSPAWMMGSQPASAASACGRSRPWVSEIAPMVRLMPDQTTRGDKDEACANAGLATPLRSPHEGIFLWAQGIHLLRESVLQEALGHCARVCPFHHGPKWRPELTRAD